MEAKNKKLGADSSKTELTAEQRIRISQHGNVTKKFVEIVTEYQEMQTKYKNKYRDRLERQYKIVKPNATTEEINKAMESGADGGGLFAQQILAGPQHAEAKRALYDIQERHQDIIKLEKSILVGYLQGDNGMTSVGSTPTFPGHGRARGCTGRYDQPD